MSRALRLFAILSALGFLAFEMASDLAATPAQSGVALLDGRPTVVNVCPAPRWRPNSGDVLRYVRFEAPRGPRYGLIENGRVLELSTGLFEDPQPTGLIHDLKAVSLVDPLAAPVPLDVLVGRPHAASGSGRSFGGLMIHQVIGPDGTWAAQGTTGNSAQEVVVHLVGVGSSAGTGAGITCGILLQDSNGVCSLALGPSVVTGLADPGGPDLRDLPRGTVVVDPRADRVATGPGVLHTSLEESGRLEIRVTVDGDAHRAGVGEA